MVISEGGYDSIGKNDRRVVVSKVIFDLSKEKHLLYIFQILALYIISVHYTFYFFSYSRKFAMTNSVDAVRENKGIAADGETDHYLCTEVVGHA